MYTIFGNSNVDLCKDVGKIDTLFIYLSIQEITVQKYTQTQTKNSYIL